MRQIKRGVRTEDEFISTTRKVMKFIVRHRETSIWIGLGFIVGVILLIYFFSRGEVYRPEAEFLQTQAISHLTAGNLPEAEKVLLQLIDRYPKTRPGKVSLYYLGVLYYHTGRFEEARHFFEEFLGKEKKDFLLTPSALLGAGAAAEGMKDYESALTYYERMIKDKDSKFYFLGALAYGRVRGLLGDWEGAREVFNELLTQNPPPDIAGDARFYLGYFNR
jgi:tetratricopeptide (TPR) repeat protein